MNVELPKMRSDGSGEDSILLTPHHEIQSQSNLRLLSVNFVTANFTMLLKNKGSSNDPSRYSCITLLNHAYKMLSYILFDRLLGMHITDGFLQD